jgi:CheY-like chemotaxis protein
MTFTILAVDDEPNNLLLLESYLEGSGHTVRSFAGGAAALEYLCGGGAADTILLDRMMPEMDGLGFMQALRALRGQSSVPVVMQTAAAAPAEIAQGIAAGAYYYLTKPFSREVLLAIVRRALHDRTIYVGLENAAARVSVASRCIEKVTMSFKTLDDVRDISFFVAAMFPDPESAILGVTELMLNAIEHGNLGITYSEKTELTRAGTWRAEIDRRLDLAEHRDKQARLCFEREAGELVLTIEDDGEGFDWTQFTSFDPLRATHSHGRGIAMAQMVSFDDVQFVAPGNKVVCRKKLPNAEAGQAAAGADASGDRA